MSNRSMSDIIEAFLKEALQEEDQIEIQRNYIAQKFDCVPSQINYVINTRFTLAHGYQVESKRGGGGYIRIFKIELVDEIDQINQMLSLIGDKLSQNKAEAMIDNLYEEGVIQKREAILMLSIIERDTLSKITDDEQKARAVIMREFLENLRYTY